MRVALLTAIPAALLFSAPFANAAEPDVQGPEVEAYLAEGQKLAQSLARIAAPLRSLTPEQRASLAALLLVTRTVAEAHFATAGGSRVLEEVWKETGEICPPIKTAQFSRGGCVDADIAYASSMASCLKKGNSESKCEKLASPELAAATRCHMKAIEQLRVAIGGLPGGTWPTGPFPWPPTDPSMRPTSRP